MKIIRVSASLILLSFVSCAHRPSSGGEYGKGITAREIAKTTVAADGRPIRYLGTDKPEVTALIIEIPPGGETGWHFHLVPVYAYVIQGTLDVEMENGNVNTYQEGEVFIEMVSTPHNGKNMGHNTVALVAFYTGEQGTPNTVKVPEVKKPGR